MDKYKHLQSLGFVEYDAGGGDTVMYRPFPARHYVWVTTANGRVDFKETDATTLIHVYDNDSQVIKNGSFESTAGSFEADLKKACLLAYLAGRKALDMKIVVENGIHEVFAYIQGQIGVTDGGYASMYLSGNREDELVNLLTGYANAELDSMAAEFQSEDMTPLDTKVSQYSNVPAEQVAYEAYCKVLFDIGLLLMTKERGTFLVAPTKTYFVSDALGTTQLMVAPGDKPWLNAAETWSNTNAIRFGTEITGLGAEAIRDVTAELTQALANPVFRKEEWRGQLDEAILASTF